VSQLDFVKEIVRLKEKFPSYEIIFFVASDEMADTMYTRHEISDVRVEAVMEYGDYIYIGESNIRERLEDDEYDPDVIDSMYKELVSMTICVYTGAV
jgi:hypothetical protein